MVLADFTPIAPRVADDTGAENNTEHAVKTKPNRTFGETDQRLTIIIDSGTDQSTRVARLYRWMALHIDRGRVVQGDVRCAPKTDLKRICVRRLSQILCT